MKNTIKCTRKFRGVHMKISSISSGSKGNCIVVDNENTTLMVDVGISRKQKKVWSFLIRRQMMWMEYLLPMNIATT